MFLIVPPQIYMERLNNGFTGGFWAFYKTVFNFVPYPKGSFSWHHLWFIAYLFLYDILFAPLFAWMASPKSVALKQKLALLARGKWIYLIMLPGITWYALLASKFPETNDLTHDYCYFVYWLFFLLAGFICITQPLLMDSLERNRRFALTIGFVCLIFLDCLRWNKIEPGEPQWPFGGQSFIELFLALKAIVGWSWVLALVGYGKKYMNRKLKILDYLNQAVYPFYILHQTVIVILVYYIVQTQNESILSKYIYTVGITFFITVGTYHLLIRPYAFTRFLFGMKPKEVKTPAIAAETEKLDEVAMLSA